MCAANAMFTLVGSRLFRLLSKIAQEAVAYCSTTGGMVTRWRLWMRYAPGRGRAWGASMGCGTRAQQRQRSGKACRQDLGMVLVSSRRESESGWRGKLANGERKKAWEEAWYGGGDARDDARCAGDFFGALSLLSQAAQGCGLGNSRQQHPRFAQQLAHGAC